MERAVELYPDMGIIKPADRARESLKAFRTNRDTGADAEEWRNAGKAASPGGDIGNLRKFAHASGRAVIGGKNHQFAIRAPKVDIMLHGTTHGAAP